MMAICLRRKERGQALKKPNDIRNVDSVIVSMAQMIQPCEPNKLAVQTKATLRELNMTKKQIQSRINSLEASGFLWSRVDKLMIVTPKGNLLSKGSMPPKERDKFRLLLLNKAYYK